MNESDEKAKKDAQALYGKALEVAIQDLVTRHVRQMAEVVAECHRKVAEAEQQRDAAERRQNLVACVGIWDAYAHEKLPFSRAEHLMKYRYGINADDVMEMFPRVGR